MSSIFPPGRILILPSRLAVDRERRRLLKASSAGVVWGPRVYYFGQVESILRSQLGLSVISDLGRSMILEELIEAEKTRLGWPRDRIGRGFVERVSDLLEQLKASGLDPEKWLKIAENVVSRERLEGVHAVYRAYEVFLEKQGRTDRAGARRTIIRALEEGWSFRFLGDINEIVIRDFNRFTPFQLELTKALARAVNRVEVHLTRPDWINEIPTADDPDWQGNPFYETLAVLRSLEALGDRVPALELASAQTSTRPPALDRLKFLYHPRPPGDSRPAPDTEMEILAIPGRYQEIEEIGRRIFSLINKDGVSPDRIGLAVPDLGVYGQLVEDVFRRFSLPFFFRRGAALAIQAPVRALLGLVRLAGSTWDRVRVLDVLASPYLDVGLGISWTRAAELSALAGVTDERAGGGWETNLGRVIRSGYERDRADADELLRGLGRLQEIVSPLAGPLTWARFAETALAVLKNLGLEERIKAGGPELHRDATAWAALKESLEDLTQAATQSGRTEALLSNEEIIRGLRQVLEERTVGERGDPGGGIMVLSVYDLHGLTFDHLFLAGMNEGEFPQVRLEDRYLRDRQMEAINRAAGRRVLVTRAAEYRLDEVIFWHAAASAERTLTFTYTRLDDRGRLRLPSALLDEVIRLWPENSLLVKKLPAQVTPRLDSALTREEVLGALGANLLGTEPGLEVETAREVLSALLERPAEKARWESLAGRARMEKARAAGGNDSYSGIVAPESLAPWLEKGLNRYQDDPLLSPTFLEEYGACPFLFWVHRLLGLDEPPEAEDEMKAIDEGALLHQILFRFMTECADRGGLPLVGTPEEAEHLAKTARETIAWAESVMPLGRQPLWEARKRNINRALFNWLEYEPGREGEFVPTLFEWTFGPPGEIEPLEVPLASGVSLFFRGRIDRIDVAQAGIRVIDYKNSSNVAKYKKMLKAEELGLTSLQAPLYQAAASKNLKLPAEAGLAPAQGIFRQTDG